MRLWFERFDGQGNRVAQVRRIQQLAKAELCHGFVPVSTFLEAAKRKEVVVVAGSTESGRIEAFCIFDDRGTPRIDTELNDEYGHIQWSFRKQGRELKISKQTHAEIIIWCSSRQVPGSGSLVFQSALAMISRTGKRVVLVQGMNDNAETNDKASQLYQHKYGFERVDLYGAPNVNYIVLERGPVTQAELNEWDRVAFE